MSEEQRAWTERAWTEDDEADLACAMTKREFFAGLVLQAIVSRDSCTVLGDTNIEDACYGLADRMLKAGKADD